MNNKFPKQLDRKIIYENEVQIKKWIPKDKVLDMIKNNEIQCGVSILALLYAINFYI